jgi:hypothetical protein
VITEELFKADALLTAFGLAIKPVYWLRGLLIPDGTLS